MNQMNIFQDYTIYFGVKSIIKVHSYLHTCIWHDFKFFEKGKETIVKSINTINSNYTYLRKHALLVSEGQETLTLFVSFLKLANFAWTSFKLISRGTGAREDTHKFLHPSCSVLFQPFPVPVPSLGRVQRKWTSNRPLYATMPSPHDGLWNNVWITFFPFFSLRISRFESLLFLHS